MGRHCVAVCCNICTVARKNSCRIAGESCYEVVGSCEVQKVVRFGFLLPRNLIKTCMYVCVCVCMCVCVCVLHMSKIVQDIRTRTVATAHLPSSNIRDHIHRKAQLPRHHRWQHPVAQWLYRSPAGLVPSAMHDR